MPGTFLRTSTKFYRPRMGRALPEAVAFTDFDGGEAGLEVLLPTRYIVYDTKTMRHNAFVFHADDAGNMSLPDEDIDLRFDPKRLIKDEDFQVSYSFSRDIRSTARGYGASGITFRQLYDFLCTFYNSGERFIDTYFTTKFPYCAVGRRFKEFGSEARGKLNAEHERRYKAALQRKQTKRSAPDMRTREGMRLKDFDVWKEAYVQTELRRFRMEIRDDIIASLSTGQIPLNLRRLANKTIDARKRAHITSRHVFFATGQLIENIQLDIRMPEDAFAA